VWDLRDGKIRVYDGEFSEWEEVRDKEEKAKAAKEAAIVAERRAQDRAQAKQRSESDTKVRGNARDVRRAVERAEGRVAELEKKVAELDAALSDDAVYTRKNGHSHAKALSRELAVTKSSLVEAMRTWEDALALAEALETAS